MAAWQEPDPDFRDAKVGGYVGASLFGGFGLVFVVMLVVAIGGTIYDRNQNGTVPVVALIAIPALLVLIGVFGRFGWWSLRQLRMWKRLETRPRTAWGTLGPFRRTGTKINTRHLYRFSVTVALEGTPPYEAEAKWFFPSDLHDVVTPGLTVALRVDPRDPSKVIIDWPAS